MIIYAHCIYITGKYAGFAVGILDAVLLKSAKYAEKRVIMARFTLPRDLYHGKGALEALKEFSGKRAIVVSVVVR